MKRKLKKILRLFLLFLSSFALVLCWFPAEALANEYDGNSYTYPFTHTVDSVKLWACYLYQKLEEQGYYVTSKIEDFSDEVKEVCLEYGIDVYNAAGEYIDNGVEYVNTITGLVIDYSNPYIQEFIEGSKNWEITDKASDTWDFYYNLYKHFFSFSDTLTIEGYFENPNAFSASGRNNIDKYFSFKNYGLSRGNYDSILGSDISSDDWVTPSAISYRFTTYTGGTPFGNFGSTSVSQILGTQTNNYSYSYLSGSSTYDSGSVIFGFTQSQQYFDTDMFRVIVTLNFPVSSGTFALSGSFTNSVAEGATSSSGNVFSFNNSTVVIDLYFDTFSNGNFRIHWNDYVSGGVIAPDQPIYTMPDPSDPNYETEKKNYDYFVTETDRSIDEYNISSFMNDIRNTFDDTPWLFYPIEFYNQVASVLTDNYSDTFDFTLEEMNFSSIADGFVIPHKEFHFDPDTLPNTVKVLFRLFQWIITFSYFWALINWGRSLILRFGSDSTHIDYEDN